MKPIYLAAAACRVSATRWWVRSGRWTYGAPGEVRMLWRKPKFGVNQLGFVSSYSPIQDNGQAHNTAGVPYYGMLAFAYARSGSSQSIALEVPAADLDLTAYAFGNDGM